MTNIDTVILLKLSDKLEANRDRKMEGGKDIGIWC